MEKEFIIKKSSTLCVNVVANQVESLRKVVETTSTVRAYDNGFVGIAGQIGDKNLDNLEKQAVENLENKLPYPCLLPENGSKHVDATKAIINPDNFVAVCRSLLSKLTAAEPDYLLNNKILYIENETSYRNTKNTDYSYRGNEMLVELTVKNKSTANLMDLFVIADVTEYNEDNIVADYKKMCDPFTTPADINDGEYTVVADASFFGGNALSHFTGEMYAAGASLFKEQLNKKIFNEKLSIVLNKTEKQINVRFFDDEGEVAENNLSYIIKDGVFVNTLCNKKVAAQYNLPRAKCSAASYDGIPSFAINGLEFAPVDKNIKELIGDGKAIYVIIASGGDMTSTGDFATPVQAAYLIENGKLVGKLPQLNIYGNVKDFLGDGFIGATYDGFLNQKDQQVIVARMNVSHIE